MAYETRRQFLGNVAQGMVAASVGWGAALEMGFAPSRAMADDAPERLRFGPLSPLVDLLQETPADRLLPLLVEQLRAGTDLRKLVAAAALANARSFGGDDYVGFHTLMALAPAHAMSEELPTASRPLPVFKVLVRNSARIQEAGFAKKDTLVPVKPAELSDLSKGSEALRDAVRRKDRDAAERTFARLAQGRPEDAFNDLVATVEDNTEVHRVVLPFRAWELLSYVGPEHAHTLLRQSVRYCANSEQHNPGRAKTALAAALERHPLNDLPAATRKADDAWVEKFAQTIFSSSPEDAAAAAAGALAEGFSADDVGEAISLVANQLVLRDPGRTSKHSNAVKPPGSVHGDSVGVHASDAVHAWRGIARAARGRNAAAAIVLAAYEAATNRMGYGTNDLLTIEPRPGPDALAKVASKEPTALLKDLDDAVRTNDQERACAITHRYGSLAHGSPGYEARPLLDVLLRYAVSEDGALHAEKYYRTTTQEFARTRPAFRWRQFVALARVTASEHGRPAPGMEEARKLLGV